MRRRSSATSLALPLAALLSAACGDSADPSQVVAEVSSQVSTVVNVRWTTGMPSIGYVEYGLTRDLGSKTPLEADTVTAHAVSLLGLVSDTIYYYRVVVTRDGAVASASDVASIRTGDLPVGLPALTRTGDGYDGFVVVPILGSKTAVIIFNAQGDIVWYHTDDRQLDFYRARLSVDGKSLLYNAAKISGEPSEASEIVRVSLDGSRTSAIPVPLLAHDFVEHPDGTLAAIAFEDRDASGTRVRGNKIVEIDLAGNQKTVWTSWDCFDFAKDKGDNPEQGWTFANALDYDPTEDVYYVGMRNFSSIARVNPRTTPATCDWVLGLSAPTFTFTADSARFLHEHQFEVRGNHILIMDNDGNPTHTSRVLEYELDLTNKVAKQVWSYVATPSVYTFVLGEPMRLPDGGTFVNWSAAGQMERLDPAGTSIWKVNTAAGFVFGFHTLASSLYAGAAATFR